MSHSSSTLVNVAEDAEQRLVQLLGASSNAKPAFFQTCEQCLVNGDAAGLLQTIIGHSGAMEALMNTEEAVFAVLAALLDRVSSNDQESQLAASLAAAVESSKVDINKKIRLLSCLYNLRATPFEKCALLAKMVALATPEMLKEGQPLAEMIDGIKTLLDAWKVQPADRRHLYNSIAQADESKRQKFTILLVETYQDAAQIDKAGLEAAKQASIGAIRDPVSLFQQQRGMLSLPAIKALGTKPDTKELYALLVIFLEGKLEDYRAFKGDLSKYGLDSEVCTRYMRILSLCSLAAEHEEVPYDEVAKTLDVQPEHVESWVIAAVSSGLLSAKMDQVNKKIMVERSVVRKFDMEQWKALQSQLHAWKHNLTAILEAFQQQQEIGSSA